MRTIDFTKMTGAGNDFIVVEAPIKNSLKKLAIAVCDRTNGIGADGLLVLDKSRTCDYKMRIINADGSEAEMCGNGARCFAAYIERHKTKKNHIFSVETKAGIILGHAKKEIATVRLSNPKDYKEKIMIKINGKSLNLSYIDTGVPHAVIFVDKLKKIDVDTIGRKVRNHNKFKPRGTNVNFVEEINRELIRARTYERGVESETKACGTGSVAAGLIAYLRMNPDITTKKKAKVNVKTKSGEVLEISFDLKENKISNVWLKGSAKFIAKGEYYV